MSQDVGYYTLAAEAARELGITELLRGVPANAHPYGKWAWDSAMQDAAASDSLQFVIVYFARNDTAPSEAIAGSYKPLPPSEQEQEKYKERVKNAIRKIQASLLE